MLRNITVYFALAVLSVSCGGNADDQSQAAESDAKAVVADMAEQVVAEAESAPVADDKGKALFTPCVACHGANGEGNMALNAPGIAGQSETYLVRQLWEFKKGLRGAEEGDMIGAQMRPMAMALPDGTAIANVAAYIASLPPTKPPVTVEGDAAQGEKIYISKCGACHGGTAWGNEALYTPRLTMLGDAYVVRQVKKFQEGMRGAHKDAKYGQQMAIVAKNVSEEELNDIAAFLNELAAEE
jgi:cytochrome c oxidase subunit II